VLAHLRELATNWNEVGHIPEFDWSRIRQVDFQQMWRDKQELLRQMSECVCKSCPDLDEHYGMKHREWILQQQMKELAHNISDQNLELLPDYHQRVQVLKELGFVDENAIVQMKGRVACEINTADELLLTELILDNFFANYEPAELVALLSVFVFQEKASTSCSNIEPQQGICTDAGHQEDPAASRRHLRSPSWLWIECDQGGCPQ
jgi:antiviral helicase SKI2